MARRKHVDLHPDQTCPLCRERLADAPKSSLTICGRCDVVYHKDCAQELGRNRCAVPGCVAPKLPADAEAPPALPCPRCKRGLHEGAYKHKIPGASCPGCGGLLLAQRDLRGFLEALADDLLREIHPDTPVEPLPDGGGGLPCPRCATRMDHAGYMGARVVMIDRCEACALVWLDADEAGRMALLYARTTMRQQRFADGIAPMELADPRAALREARDLVRRHFLRHDPRGPGPC